MPSKLTLSIEEEVIAQAKLYAQNQGRSLSSIVEEYLKSVSKRRKKKADPGHHLDPLVEELCGSVKISSDRPYKDLIGDAVIERYLNR